MQTILVLPKTIVAYCHGERHTSSPEAIANGAAPVWFPSFIFCPSCNPKHECHVENGKSTRFENDPDEPMTAQQEYDNGCIDFCDGCKKPILPRLEWGAYYCVNQGYKGDPPSAIDKMEVWNSALPEEIEPELGSAYVEGMIAYRKAIIANDIEPDSQPVCSCPDGAQDKPWCPHKIVALDELGHAERLRMDRDFQHGVGLYADGWVGSHTEVRNVLGITDL